MNAIAPPAGASARWLALGAGTAAVASGLAAAVSPSLGLATSVALLFAAVAFESLPAGLALFAAITFFERVPGAETAVPLGKIAVVILVLAALRRSGAPLLFREHPVLAGSAVFLASWAGASVLWAPNASAALAEALRLATAIAVVFVVFAAVREKRHVHWLVWGYVAGAVLTVLAGLAGVGAAPVADASDRLVGAVGDPDVLAALVVPALPMTAFALGTVRGVLSRWLLLGCLGLLAFALLLTQSRGGVIALVTAFVFAVLFGGRHRGHVLVVLLVLSAVFLAYWSIVATPDARERVAHVTSGGDAGRLDTWSVAGRAVADHPLVGVGAGNFTTVEPIYASETINLPHVRFVLDEPRAVHNTFLQVLTELGIVGLAAFAAIVLGVLALGHVAITASRRAGELELELLARGIFVGTLSMLVAFVFVSGQAREQLWLLMGLLIVLPSLADHDSRTPRPWARYRPKHAVT